MQGAGLFCLTGKCVLVVLLWRAATESPVAFGFLVVVMWGNFLHFEHSPVRFLILFTGKTCMMVAVCYKSVSSCFSCVLGLLACQTSLVQA